jgi:hypothetical protein
LVSDQRTTRCLSASGRRQQDRLLNVHLAGTIDDQTFAAKNLELRGRVAKLTLQLEATDRKKYENAIWRCGC